MKRLFIICFFIVACSQDKRVIKQEIIGKDYGSLSTYGSVVYITRPDLNEFNVHFYTDLPEKSKLTIFRPDGNVVVEEKTNFNFHYFELKKENELTVFQMFSSQEILNKKIIKVTIPHKTPYKFGVLGGYMENEEKYKELSKILGNNLPVFTIYVGSFVKNTKNLTQWTTFINNSQDFLVNSVLIPAFDEETKNSEMAEKIFYGLQSYKSYYYPFFRLIVLDTSIEFKKGSSQYEFLESELKSATLEWKVVVLSKNPFLNQSENIVKSINNELIPLFEKHKVNLVITSGRKGFERYVKNNITYISTSCNEKMVNLQDKTFLIKSIENEENIILCEVLQKRLLFKVFNVANKLIDEFQVIE